uniref:Palmdelphin n=1 Tax=Sinocyclocheilus grahami TaxID=75366 RepID=A0A672T4A6_SINGR
MIIFTIFAELIYIHSTIPNMLKPSTPLLKQRKKQDLETEAKTDQTKSGKLKEDFKLFSIYSISPHFMNMDTQMSYLLLILHIELGYKKEFNVLNNSNILRTFHLSLTALFAMEINVQKDLRTGESQVLSTSTISPQELQQKGIKVYDDGRKSVYALRTDGHQPGANGVDELSSVEVEELLRQASEKKKRSNQVQIDPSYPHNLSHELQLATEIRESHDSKLSVLNAMPSDEPVTMIFMGYQNAGDDSQSYEGSVRAELVIIGDGEDEASKSFNPHQNCIANNAFPYSAGRKGKRDGTEDPSATGTPKIKKVKRRHKHCCVLM